MLRTQWNVANNAFVPHHRDSVYQSRSSACSGTPSALMRVRKTLYYIIDWCPKRQIKCSPIFNPTRLRTESPNFLYANISAFTVYKW